MDLNQLYFDHQLLLMQAERATSAERRDIYRQGASLVAGRIGCMQVALGARAASHWAETAAADSDRTGNPPPCLPFGPPRVPHDWRSAAKAARP